MSKKVTYHDLDMVKKSKLDLVYGVVEGFISKAGVKDESFEYNGETVKKAKVYISLPNKEEKLCKVLDIPQEALMLNEAKNGEDKYVTIPIALYYYNAENALKVLKPGQKVRFLGEYTTPTKKDGTKMFEFMAMAPAAILYFPKTEGDAPEQPEATSNPAPAEAPTAPTETYSEPLVNVGDDDLPF